MKNSTNSNNKSKLSTISKSVIKKEKEKFFLGETIDQLSEIINLVECQFDSLVCLDNEYGCGGHHLTLNSIIGKKLKGIRNSISNLI